MTHTDKFDGSPRFDPAFDDVYAAIANAVRYAGGAGAGSARKVPMTKGRVAAVHRKMLAGEALDAGQEQDIAGRLRRQLGPEHRPGAEAKMIGEDAASRSGSESESESESEQAEIDREVSQTGQALRVDAEREGEREEAGGQRVEARPETSSSLEALSPAQWEELRAWSGDNLAAARAILKDAGSVTRWSRVLVERARGLRREGEARDGTHALTVRMEGALDLQTSPALLALLLELAGDEAALGGSRTVLLDLSGVGFIDMSGCRAMIEGSRALGKRGRTLAALHRPGSQPERVFLGLSLGMIIRRVESLDDL